MIPVEGKNLNSIKNIAAAILLPFMMITGTYMVVKDTLTRSQEDGQA